MSLWASSALSSWSARLCPQTHGPWLCHRRQLVVPCTEIEQARCQTKLGLFAGPFCFVCNNIIFGRTQGRFLAGDTALADRLAATIHLVRQRQSSIRRPQRNIRGHNIPLSSHTLLTDQVCELLPWIWHRNSVNLSLGRWSRVSNGQSPITRAHWLSQVVEIKQTIPV